VARDNTPPDPGSGSSQQASTTHRGTFPDVGRPRGSALRGLEAEGVIFETQVLIVGGESDLAARLILTSKRLVLVAGGEIAIDIQREWLRPQPRLIAENGIRVFITPEAAEAGGDQTERISLRARDGRGAAVQIISAVTGRPVPGAQADPARSASSEAAPAIVAEIPKWSTSVGASPTVALPALPDVLSSASAAASKAPGRSWPPVEKNGVGATPSRAIPTRTQSSSDGLYRPLPATGGSDATFRGRTNDSITSWTSRHLDSTDPAPVPSTVSRAARRQVTLSNGVTSVEESVPMIAAQASKALKPGLGHRSLVWGLRMVILFVLIGTGAYLGRDYLRQQARDLNVPIPSRIETQLGISSKDDTTAQIDPTSQLQAGDGNQGVVPTLPATHGDNTRDDLGSTTGLIVPTDEPAVTPTGEPTEAQVIVPTDAPTEEPVVLPTDVPTEEPVVLPTDVPTEESALLPTDEPVIAPNDIPTQEPTIAPTDVPTQAPTSEPTVAPTDMPTDVPTQEPTSEPTAVPTQEPTSEPTAVPTQVPTTAPTDVLTDVPTREPTTVPTEAPTTVPTDVPTREPTTPPTQAPTTIPTETSTQEPTTVPTQAPTIVPTDVPTPQAPSEPTAVPTELPTQQATSDPTSVPTQTPVPAPTVEATEVVLVTPTIVPQAPSVDPSVTPDQQIATANFRFSVAGAEIGESIPDLPEINAVTYGQWLVLSVNGTNTSGTDEVFDMNAFTLVADGSDVQVDVGNAWIAGMLGYSPAYGNTDSIIWAPGESHQFALTFLAPLDAKSLVLKVGDQVMDLSSTLGGDTSLLDATAQDAAKQPEVIEAKVVEVVNAETIVVEIDGIRQAVRYLGLNAPTGDECFAVEATSANSALVAGKTVRIERQATNVDARGNWVRDVWAPTSDGSYALVSELLVREGAGRSGVTEPNTRFAGWLMGSESAARAQGIGLWKSCGNTAAKTSAGTGQPVAVTVPTAVVLPAPASRYLSFIH
jgi:endonuclease YncB( thermonuclease family)